MGERFEKTKLALSIIAILISTAATVVAVLAWRASDATERKQLALAREAYNHSMPRLSGEGGLDFYASDGKEVYTWYATGGTPSPVTLEEWQNDSPFVYVRIANTGGEAARLSNYGLAFAPDKWMPVGHSSVSCKPQAWVDWSSCDPNGDLVQPGQIIFVGFYLTRDLISYVSDGFRHGIVISYEAGAYNVQNVRIPIAIPPTSDLGY